MESFENESSDSSFNDESTDSSSEPGEIHAADCPIKPTKRVKTKNLIKHIYNPPCMKGRDTAEATTDVYKVWANFRSVLSRSVRRDYMTTGGTLQDVYTPLSPNTIRLVHLTKYHSRSSIPECSLSECRIHDSAESTNTFTAVSYTWLAEEYSWYGVDLPDSTTMVIQNHLISVPSRIALILGVLFEVGVRNVWMDYLSINQLDVVERGQQVAIMDQIFAAAAQTIIFLGMPTKDTDLVFTHPPKRRDRGFIYIPPETQDGVDQIARHRYWQRAWILQEIAFSKYVRVVCGNFIVDSRTFCLQVSIATADYQDDPDYRMLWGFTQRLLDGGFRNDMKDSSLRDIAWHTRNAECSDPRDALFSKINFAKDEHRLGLPDYTESVGSLFTRFAVSYLAAPGGLERLDLASGSANRLQMPSWVADWTPRRGLPPMDLVAGLSSMFPPYQRRRETPRRYPVSVTDGNKELVVLGRVIKKMRPFSHNQQLETHIEQTKPDVPGELALEDSMVCGDKFLSLVYGCDTLLVLEWREGHYVIWNTRESDELEDWADGELKEAFSQRCPRTYNFSEFRIR